MNLCMQIAAYLKTSLIEWPGKIASVVFTPGCNFRCPFCHNGHLVDPKQINGLALLKKQEVLEDLEKRKGWIDAVAVTGGEPTLQKDLPEFLKDIKALGFLVMLEQNGTNPGVLEVLIDKGLVDYFCMDLKGNFEDYEKFTGVKVDLEKIKESIRLIIGSGVEYEFRTTVVPRLHTKENLVRLATEVNDIFENCKLKIENCKWYFQQFRPLNCFDPEFQKLQPYSRQDLESFLKEIRKIIPNTHLRGV